MSASLVAPHTDQPDAYTTFLATKRRVMSEVGITVDDKALHPRLYPFQVALTRWALRKGRAALLADCGLGKSCMQLEWARLLAVPALIVAPLGVTQQTVDEAARLDIPLTYARGMREVKPGNTLTITNYEMVDHFDPAAFGAVVLDESSILKALDGKTRAKLTTRFATTPYRLCCSATPAPNDITELANHAEFLGVMSRVEMLAMFFVHDDQGWRLKGHAQEAFYRWLASWAMCVHTPRDIGYPDDGYVLPALSIEPEWIEMDCQATGRMFFVDLKGVGDRAAMRRRTAAGRVARTVELVNAPGDGGRDQWVLWCGLNEEGRKLHDAIPDSRLMEGTQTPEEKMAALDAFCSGACRVLISKPKIAGFGLNLQHAHRMAFVGMSDSWEAYYQCIRRCWRFGQRDRVRAHIVLSEAERQIFENVRRKEREAEEMTRKLIEQVQTFERDELVEEPVETWDYATATTRGATYTAMLGDSVERMAEIDTESVGLSVFSPPFQSLYTYSPTERDIGNSQGRDEFDRHFGYIVDHLLRVTLPGRNCCVHVAQVPAMLARDGYIGLKDFRGQVIALFGARGWVYHGEVCVDKDPQAQAIRTHSKALLFAQLRKDSAWLRPALADYILVFRKPGENPHPITPDLTNEEWISWARPIWYGIRESDTLNVAEGRDDRDERHIAPLQLGTIERCVRLWSNPGDLVCSPFMGIASEGYEAVRLNRRFVGCELKPSYYAASCKNLARAARTASAATLWDGLGAIKEAGEVSLKGSTHLAV